jgi:hypothetical protein
MFRETRTSQIGPIGPTLKLLSANALPLSSLIDGQEVDEPTETAKETYCTAARYLATDYEGT